MVFVAMGVPPGASIIWHWNKKGQTEVKMQHQSLLQLLAGDEEFRQIADGLKNRLQHQAVFGLAGSQKHFWWAGLASRQENLQF
jgi:hypothetical protein